MFFEREITVCTQCNKSYKLTDINPTLSNLLSALSVKTHEEGLCLSCYIDNLKKLIDHYLQDLTQEKICHVQQLGKPSYLIHGIDYNINESGLWVFTKWYLLRKGPCCARGCVNCPY